MTALVQLAPYIQFLTICRVSTFATPEGKLHTHTLHELVVPSNGWGSAYVDLKFRYRSKTAPAQKL